MLASAPPSGIIIRSRGGGRGEGGGGPGPPGRDPPRLFNFYQRLVLVLVGGAGAAL